MRRAAILTSHSFKVKAFLGKGFHWIWERLKGESGLQIPTHLLREIVNPLLSQAIMRGRFRPTISHPL